MVIIISVEEEKIASMLIGTTPADATEHYPFARVSPKSCSSSVLVDYEGQNKKFFINTNEESNVYTRLQQCPYGGGGHPLLLEAADDPLLLSPTFLFSSSEDDDFTFMVKGCSTRNVAFLEHITSSADSGSEMPGWLE